MVKETPLAEFLSGRSMHQAGLLYGRQWVQAQIELASDMSENDGRTEFEETHRVATMRSPAKSDALTMLQGIFAHARNNPSHKAAYDELHSEMFLFASEFNEEIADALTPDFVRGFLEGVRHAHGEALLASYQAEKGPKIASGTHLFCRCPKCGFSTILPDDGSRDRWCSVCSFFGDGDVRYNQRRVRPADKAIVDLRRIQTADAFHLSMAYAMSKGIDIEMGLGRFEQELEKRDRDALASGKDVSDFVLESSIGRSSKHPWPTRQ
ncbi:hypothetical protein E0J20_09350 [Rhizobium leguminosarum bv. viciae]|nr:hypothetical protein E0J20_09350 [Rhizobium leguminosarum bv. viciae]